MQFIYNQLSPAATLAEKCDVSLVNRTVKLQPLLYMHHAIDSARATCENISSV